MSIHDDIINRRVDLYILERYQVVAYLPSGGMGVVFVCFDNKYKRFIAVKTYNTGLIDRICEEATAWVNFEKHQNIVQAFDISVIDGQPFIFMEFVIGPPEFVTLVNGNVEFGSSLRSWLVHRKKLSATETIKFGIQFCRGIEYASQVFSNNQQIFLHRDIKPENILINHDGVLKITDFGLVNTLNSGTPQYMAPECFEGEASLDIRSDVYSFGCVLYEMLAGHRPLDRENPIPLERVIPAIPRELSRIVMGCLAKDREQRFSSFEGVRQKLDDLHIEFIGHRFPIPTPLELNTWERLNKVFNLNVLSAYTYQAKPEKSRILRKNAVQELVTTLSIDRAIVHQLFPKKLCAINKVYCPHYVMDKVEKTNRIMQQNNMDKFIVIISSHGNRIKAQEIIIKLLEVVSFRMGIRLIANEGGSGEINLDFYASLKDEEAKYKIANYFLNEGRISGAENFAILKPREIVFYGADDMKLYNCHEKLFWKLQKHRTTILQSCGKVKEILKLIKPHIYNDQALVFEKESKQRRDSIEYANWLISYRAAIGLKRIPLNVSLWLKVLTLEKEINTAKAQSQQQQLIEILVKRLPNEQKLRLMQIHSDLASKDITTGQFYQEWYHLSKSFIGKECVVNYPDFFKLARAEITFSLINNMDFFEELSILESDTLEQLLQDNDSRRLNQYYNYIDMLEKACTQGIGPKAAHLFLANSTEIKISEIVAFMEQQTCRKDIFGHELFRDIKLPIPQSVRRILSLAAIFATKEYSIAFQRSEKLLDNTLLAMNNSHEVSAVLVISGFHTETITRRLREIGVAHVSVYPHASATLVESDEWSRYLRQLRGEKTKLEDNLSIND